jgi:putative oxidoreductase
MTTQNSKILNITLWVAQVVLGGMFLMAGIMKISSPIEELSVTVIWAKDLPLLVVRFIGAAELSGALGLLLPSLFRIKPLLTPTAAFGLVIIMTMAAIFHITRSEFPAIAFNATLGIVATFIAWGRFKKVPIQARA